jgi:hypothetical protein
MKHVLIVSFLIALLLAPLCLARAGHTVPGDYAIPWHIMDGGGFSQGGSYSLQGAIGQPVVGSLQGGDYTLAGGYWPVFKQRWSQYLPGILKAP